MKIKNIFASVIIAALGLGLAASCDDIKEGDRYVQIPGTEEPSTPEDPSTPEEPSTPEDPDVIQPAPRVAFLEEFTGQMCSNCPEAHGIITTLKEQYGESFVPVSVHTTYGNFGMTGPVGLANEESDYYASKWTLSSLPTGAVNMTELSGRDTWAGLIRPIIRETAPVGITLTATVDADVVKVIGKMAAAEGVSGTLVIWLTESGIVRPQLQPDGSMKIDYVHNHVFRAAIGGRDGNAVSLAANTETDFSYSLDIAGKGYDPNNLAVVAFIMKDSWRNVIQAAEAHVTASGAE